MSSKQVVRQTRNELAALFGGDGRSWMYTKIFLEGAAPTFVQPINVAQNKLALDFMSCGNYEPSAKVPGMLDNDVHYEFTDFIIQTALFHRLIDTPSGLGTRLSNVTSVIRNDIISALNNTSANGQIAGMPINGIAQYGVNIDATRNLNAMPDGKRFLGVIISDIHGAPGVGGKPVPNVMGANDDIATIMATLGSRLLTPAGAAPGAIYDLVKNNDLQEPQKSQLYDDIVANFDFTTTSQMRNYVTKTIVPQINNAISSNSVANLLDSLYDQFENEVVRIINDYITGELKKYYAPQKTSLTTSESENFWNKLNWPSLSFESKQLYKKFINFEKETNGVWQEVDPDMISPWAPQASKDKVRVNLKKMGGVPVFATLIPLHPGQPILGNIWYSDINGNKRQVMYESTGQKVFQELYNNVYHGIDNQAIVGTTMFFTNVPNTWDKNVVSMYFHVNVDQLVRNRLFQVQRYMQQPEIDTTPLLSFTDKNIWLRDSQGKLYREVNGTVVYYDADSQATKDALKKNFKCYSTLVNAPNTETCERYMFKCLLNENPDAIKDCLEFWNTQDFYTVARNEISNMLPIVALRTLQRYGFREHEEFDPECNMNVRKVETTNHWLQNYVAKKYANELAPGSTKTIKQVIESNQKLISYLQLLTEYVNGNPQILNGNCFTGKTLEQVGTPVRSELAVKLKIPFRKEPKGFTSSVGYDCGMLQSHLDKSYAGLTLRAAAKSPTFSSLFSNSRFSPSGAFPGFAGLAGSQQGFPLMVGGTIPDINTYLRRKESGIVAGPEALFKLIQTTIEQLKSMNKTLDPNDEKRIKQQIDTMKTIETELIKTERYLEEFKQLRMLLQDYNSEFLTLDNIKQLVGKRTDLLGKQVTVEDSLMKILTSLQKLATGKSDDFTTDVGYKPLGDARF